MKIIYIFVILALAITFGCSDESDPTTPHKDHFEPVGIVIYQGSEIFIKINQGVFNPEYYDHFPVPVDGETDVYTVKFINEDGDETDPPHDEEFDLAWEITDPDIIEITRDSGEKWQFKLKGLAAGETEISFKVKHVDHFGFESKFIPVVVE